MKDDIFNDSDFLKAKIQEGKTCAFRGRAIYDLRIDDNTGKVRAVLRRKYPNLPVPFTTKGYIHFIAPENIGSVINDALFHATIRGFI